MTHEEWRGLENKMWNLMRKFWNETIENLQEEGLKGTGNVIDEKKRDEILNIDLMLHPNTATRPIGDNFIYQSISDFEQKIQKVRSQYNDINEDTIKLEDSIENFFEKVYNATNKNIKEMGMVKNNNIEIPQQAITKVIEDIDIFGKDGKTKNDLKKSINEVVLQLSKNSSPIDKRVNIEDIQNKITNKYFEKSVNLKKEFEDIIEKRLNIFNSMYDSNQKSYEKFLKENVTQKREKSKRKMDGLMYDYNQNELEMEGLREERAQLNKYINQMRFYAQQDSKETSYKKIRQQQREYTAEFLKELDNSAYNFLEWQVTDIKDMINKIKKTLELSKNGIENDDILEQMEKFVNNYFAVKIRNLEIKNVEQLEKLKDFTNNSDVLEEFDKWLSNKLEKNSEGVNVNLQISYKYIISNPEQKRKLLQLIEVNKANLEGSANKIYNKRNTPVIELSELKDKNSEEILNMLEDKFEKLMDALSKKKYPSIIKTDIKKHSKLGQRLKKILRLRQSPSMFKIMQKEVTTTDHLIKQSEQLIKRIQTSRSMLSTKTIDKYAISKKIDVAKEVAVASKEGLQDIKEKPNIKTGIVKERKKLVEKKLNKAISNNFKRKKRNKEFLQP